MKAGDAIPGHLFVTGCCWFQVVFRSLASSAVWRLAMDDGLFSYKSGGRFLRGSVPVLQGLDRQTRARHSYMLSLQGLFWFSGRFFLDWRSFGHFVRLPFGLSGIL